ncbi:hypothetical protein OENI_10033 [Oenococcus oeni]|nr:hypothetical protein OENI_10033 [Oenococcus oeni]SYW02229.1 hypothetical protein OENI_320004 [Oenococcus oeni]SYW18888.1 hypothetical protein OENI_60033 [Oenococcus oeni]
MRLIIKSKQILIHGYSMDTGSTASIKKLIFSKLYKASNFIDRMFIMISLCINYLKILNIV